MEFKLATSEHINSIMDIIQGAQLGLKKQGIDQWQNNYPNKDTIKDDVSRNNGYVLLNDKIIVGTVAVIFTGEETYDKIHEGQWLTSGKYAVIHRIGVSPNCQGAGLGSKIIKCVETMCKNKGVKSIKIDTHPKNKAMGHLLLKNDFKYCGIIYLEDGNKRIAFEKIVKN